MKIIKVKTENLVDLVDLSILMWEKESKESLIEEYSNLIPLEDVTIFLLIIENQVAGFAHCQLRYDYVEGTSSSPVGYLEGIFIKNNFRKNGYAKKLLSECEKWSKEKGCTEFSSDSELNNSESFKFHLASGFTEVNRLICYTKKI